MRRIFLTTAIFILTTLFSLPAFTQQPLYGEWELVKITRDGKDVPVTPARKTPGINFAKEWSVSGSGGCNSYGGTYTLDNGKIKFGPIRSTKMGCAQEINKQEMLFFEILDKAANYKMSKGNLTLSDGAGANALNFVSLAPPAAEPREKIFRWIVDKQQVDCRGIVHQNCLQVKERDFDQWEIRREKIIGFKYQPGRYYLIRVKRVLKPYTTTNDFIFEYKLVKIISRTRLMPHVD